MGLEAGLLVLLSLVPAQTPPDIVTNLPAAPSGRMLIHEEFTRPCGTVGHATVYLPPGYERQPERRFPLLVLLHGLGGHDTDWVEWANIRRMLDWAIDTGAIEPVIAVMPDGGNGYWVDWPDGRPEHRYATLVEPHTRTWAEQRFRTDGRRAIAGYSMGGFGALSIALRHQETYVAVLSLSGALFTQQPTGRSVYLSAFGYPGVWQGRFAFVNPIDLVRMGLGRGLAIWLDCGRDDGRKFTRGLRRMSRALIQNGVRHVARFRPGRHEWGVWAAGFLDALPWLKRKLRAARQ